MINHFRSLLMNISGPTDGKGGPWDEITETFTFIHLPQFIRTIRSLLFGSFPDNYFLGYRTRQLLALIHSTTLKEFVYALDSRITYKFDTFDWPASVFDPQVTKVSGDDQDNLIIYGQPIDTDSTGRSYFTYDISLISSSTIKVISPQTFQTVLFDLFISDGLSNEIVLPVSGYNIKLSTNDTNQRWLISIVNKPQVDLSEIVLNLSNLSEATTASLFGNIAIEPYQTFRNLWFDNNELPLKLGAFICALVYRTEEQRVSNG